MQMTATDQEAARLVYRHYKRRALRAGVNHTSAFYHLWADKALDGAVNPLVLRVRRLVSARSNETMTTLGQMVDQIAHPVHRHLTKLQASELIRLRLASPKRADACARIERQHNTDALPLFATAAEPTLF